MEYTIIEYEGRFGCKDGKGRWILVADYNQIRISYDFAICWKDDKILLFNLETKTFIYTELEDIREDKNGYLALKLEDKWGVMSTHGYDSGKTILNNWYKGVKQLSGSLYCIHQDDYYEIANSPDCYARHIDEYPTFYRNDRILAKKGGKYGFINSCNNTTIPFIYDDIIERKNENNFDVRIGNAWGIMSLEGQEIVKVKYKNKVFRRKYKDDENAWKNKYNVVEDALTGRVGIINREGKEIVPIIFNNVSVRLMKSLPKGWANCLSSSYNKDYSRSDVFLFYASSEHYSDYYDTFMSRGIYDAFGNMIVPVLYDSLVCEDNGIIIGSNYQDQLFDIYNIKGNGKCLVSNVSRVHVDSIHKRLLLFGARRVYKDNTILDVYDYCVPVDYSLKTLFKNSQGEFFQIESDTDLATINEEYKISLGGIEQNTDNLLPNYCSFLHRNSIVFNKEGKKGICFIDKQSFSQLYDEIIDQFEDDLFIIRNVTGSGLFYKGKELLQPIYYGISWVEEGYCFVINERYSLYEIDMININDIVRNHVTAFRGLTKIDVDKLLEGNYLYFKVIDNIIYFNDECPFPITDDFSKYISEKRIPLKVSWYWGVF